MFCFFFVCQNGNEVIILNDNLAVCPMPAFPGIQDHSPLFLAANIVYDCTQDGNGIDRRVKLLPFGLLWRFL